MSLETHLVSVIVNCYNSEKYISECINSIINQTYLNFEIVVWDNKSEDQTRQIIANIAKDEKRLKLYAGEKFLALGAARNQALNKCIGDWIAFLDSDDVWDRNFLSDQMNALKGKDHEYFGYGHVTIFENSELSSMQNTNRSILTNDDIGQELLKGNFIFLSSLVISRPAVNYIKSFNDDFVQAEDYELLLRLANKYKGLQVGHVYYRNHANNTSKNQGKELYIENLKILEPYLSYMSAKVNYSFNLAEFFIHSLNKGIIGDFWIVLKRSKFNYLYLSLGLAYLFAHNLKKFTTAFRLRKYKKKDINYEKF